jgi:TM2 domain-containing membrane protein YozV
MEPLTHAQGMTDAQRQLFLSEFNQRCKNQTTAIFLALALGGIGAHRFYMGNIRIGFVYLAFCWTLVPLFTSLLEIFVMPGRVDRYNERLAEELALKVKGLSAA